MTHRIAFPAVIAALLLPGLPATAKAADQYKVDLAHSAVLFRVMHVGISPTYGRFRQLEGTFALDPKAPQKSTVSIVVDAASVYTAEKKRDAHLRSPDFFNVKQYPKIKFTSTKVTRSGKNWKVAGKLELLGVVRPVTVVMAQVGEGKDPWGGYRAGFEGSLTISRSAFGMTKLMNLADDEVRLTLAFEGIKQ